MPLISLFTSNFKPIGNSFRGSGIPTNDFNYTIIPNNDLTYIFIPDNDLFNTFIVDNDVQYVLIPNNDVFHTLIPNNDNTYTLIPNNDLTYNILLPTLSYFTNLETIASYLRNYMSDFKNPDFYEYLLDGNGFFIEDGGNDMYDDANVTTPWLISNTTYTGDTPYNSLDYPYAANYQTTGTIGVIDANFGYLSLGYYNPTYLPLTVLGTRATNANEGTPIGFQSGGNIGADGNGTWVEGNIYTGDTVYGYTVHSYYRQTYDAGDPSVCDVFILLGHSDWNSEFGDVFYGGDSSNDGCGSYLYTTGYGAYNILAIKTLLSKDSGVEVTFNEVKTVVNNFIFRIYESQNYSPSPTPTPTPTITPTETPTPTPSVTVTLTPTSTPIPVNQILYYNFNDLNTINGTTVTDTFNGINGTLQNSPSTGSTSCGNYIEYDGVDNFLITGNLNPYLNPSNTSSLISIFTWVYLMNDGVIVSEQGTLPPNTNWYDSQIELVNGTLKFAVWPHSSVITSSISTPLNNWHYIGFTYDGATLRAYVNGYLAGSSTGVDRQTPYNYLGGAPLYYSIAGNCPTSLGNGGYGNFRMGTFEVYDGPLSDSTILGNFNSTYSNWNCPTPTPTPTLTITPTVTPTNTETPTPTPTPTTPISLLVHLDSSNVSSYSGTGDTWNNLAGGSNATLYNTPTYSSNYSGYLNFDDASLEYGLIPDIGSLSTWSIEVWFRLSSSLDGKYTALVTNEYTAPASLNFTIGNPTGGSNISVGFYKAGWQITTGFTPDLNVWYQVVGTYNGSTITQYINGSASGGTFNYTTTTVSGGGIRLMRRWDETLNSGNLVDGDLSIVKIYNRVLTSSEILQSYNNNYSRFLEPTPTPTVTPTNTVTPTPTSTPTSTTTQTVTPTPSISSTLTPTPSVTPSTSVIPSSIFTMTVVESGSDVIWTGSGTINITGLTDRGTTSTTAGFNGTMGIWGMGSLSPTAINKYDVVFSSSPSSYGTAGGTPNSSSGDFVAIVPGTATDRSIQVPNGYVSGNQLNNTSTFTNKTLSSLGLTPGTYTYSWGSGVTSGLITLQIGA